MGDVTEAPPEDVRAVRRLRIGAAASVVAAGAFAFLAAFGWVIFAPGRGSERAMAADVLGPALLLLAAAHAGLSVGYRALVPSPAHSRNARAVSAAAAVALAIAGAIFLLDRLPCTEGLYCSGRVLGPTGLILFYLWAFIPCSANILIAAIALDARPAGRDLYLAGFPLLLADGVLFGFLIVPMAIYAAFALGAVAHGVLAGAFVHEARRVPRSRFARADATVQRPNV